MNVHIFVPGSVLNALMHFVLPVTEILSHFTNGVEIREVAGSHRARKWGLQGLSPGSLALDPKLDLTLPA